ncbi:MAG: L-seryl-tRNA(Sec) selenium transferase [Planctomycetota bacterium]|nr:L-seryl-tRNA(Sec) selenium transferase [Planctomycetota bacterium]
MKEVTGKQLLRLLPSVDKFCALPPCEALMNRYGRETVLAAVREVTEKLREEIHGLKRPLDALQNEVAEESILKAVELRVRESQQAELCRVVNATGIVLHTGLGRAPLPAAALEAINHELGGYALLSVNREAGKRINRERAVARLVCKITGAEHATVVNNNAAAVLLATAALAHGQEVIVSRGELVEIGGSFRMPEIMAQSGVKLVEVGTTNRTYVADFERAITSCTGLLTSIHTSNFKMVGFTQNVAIEDLVGLGKRTNIPVLHDIGSGLLVDLAARGLGDEPLVQRSIAAGADVVCFSSDKMLGGPQAGIIAGKRHLVAQIRRHPLFRTYRLDKLRLTALEATLKLYLDPGTVTEKNPTLRMVTIGLDALKRQAGQLARRIRKSLPALEVTVEEEVSHLGGGAMPGYDLPTRVVAVRSTKVSAQAMLDGLRMGADDFPPIFARVKKDWTLFDPRTLIPEDTVCIIDGLRRVCEAGG